MSTDLPDYYFRVRENGAAVFRVSTENRQRRIEMDEIAVVNIRNGNIKRFKFPIRNTAEGAANEYGGQKGANLDDECLLLESNLPAPTKLAK